MSEITDHEFSRFQAFIFQEAGITMADSKRALVTGRLGKRLAQLKLDSYSQYLKILSSQADPAEVQIAIDLLTTNETYFFREPKHFEFLKQIARDATAKGQALRIWSAAGSSGEEPYSIAMVLADIQGGLPWEVVGSDISSRVLRHAHIGHYQQERASMIPAQYLKRFCLRGIDKESGTMLVQSSLRQRVQFMRINLNRQLPSMGQFDMIFLRNVMIYFSSETKRQVVQRLLDALRPGGHLLVGHSETLNDINATVRSLAPSIYVKS